MTTIKVDPKVLGKPIARPRIFFLLIRRDVLLRGMPDCELADLANMVAKKLRCSTTHRLDQLLFRADHPLVKKHLLQCKGLGKCRCVRCKRRQCCESLGSAPSKLACKWRHRHWQYMKKHNLTPSNIAKKADVLPILLGLRTQRARHVCAVVMNEHPDAEVINVSQSIGRSRMAKDTLMTITPRGDYYIVQQRRMMLTCETMMLMGFPMDVLDLSGITSAQLGSIAGNAMEAHSTATAIAATLRLVDHALFKDAVSQAVVVREEDKKAGTPWWKKKKTTA